MSVSLTDLAAGHVFEPVAFSVTPEQSLAYCRAVGDRLAVYRECGNAVPPLALVALALGALLEQVTLPPGSLHASESASFSRVVAEGTPVECRARLAQRSVRGGWVVSVLDSDLYAEGALAASARATVLSPAS